ncbi:MAG TPA: NAD(P)/FAD-dependent oxidoreductase [Gemmatimonadaceae bacterium]|nr:NAD(P)/FAD-dependent oxidoreductase [Gemmatimonadaceae bacterium]
MRAIVIGSGPNGLSAAITLARARLDVTVLESEETIGGGMRSAPLTLPGFTHDICSAIHPMGVASPFFNSLPLTQPPQDLVWIQPDAPLAHPLEAGTAVVLERSVDATADGLGADAGAYRKLFAPLVEHWDTLLPTLLAPIIPPQHPLRLARFGMKALWSAAHLARSRFANDRARALFAGMAAHSVIPLDAMASASFGLVLGMAGHAVGWPLPRGGSQRIARALASCLERLGGRILTGHAATRDDIADADAVMFDLTPHEVLRIGHERLHPRYARRLGKYRWGPASFKMDWALSQPIPWKAAECRRAGTVHVGGTLDEIARSERDAWEGRASERPFVLLAQQSLFDDTRAPSGRHTAWAYCHVPFGCDVDMTARIEAQIERFAPGFRDVVLARHVYTPGDFSAYNRNYHGGDVVGGANTFLQTLGRPMLSLDPYRMHTIGKERWFICSASTPPGGGVHGMCGYNAARSALEALGES